MLAVLETYEPETHNASQQVKHQTNLYSLSEMFLMRANH